MIYHGARCEWLFLDFFYFFKPLAKTFISHFLYIRVVDIWVTSFYLYFLLLLLTKHLYHQSQFSYMGVVGVWVIWWQGIESIDNFFSPLPDIRPTVPPDIGYRLDFCLWFFSAVYSTKCANYGVDFYLRFFLLQFFVPSSGYSTNCTGYRLLTLRFAKIQKFSLTFPFRPERW